jgi:holo-[acyl-carrier-protein] synthase
VSVKEGLLIVGLGLDIVEIDRIEAAITRHGAPILERLYTQAEVAYCESHRNNLSAMRAVLQPKKRR